MSPSMVKGLTEPEWRRAGNALLIADGQKNRAFDKKRSRGRIDGLVTIAMAVGAATMNESSKPTVDDFLASLAGA
jgi:phage terminase large subunit-like protein